MANKPDLKKKDWVRHNEQIRIPRILVVQDGKNLGEMFTRDALALAREAGLDLVEVAPHSRPPVCQIMDYGKFMYDKSKKEKQKAPQNKEKEIAFRYVIDQHDLETKANQAKDFLSKGMKVKLVVKFKAREKAHKDLGFEIIKKVIDLLQDVSSVELTPRFEGVNVIARLDVKKDKS
jgi:translation initiation factor IF-3